jgi:hypothetical protein
MNRHDETKCDILGPYETLLTLGNLDRPMPSAEDLPPIESRMTRSKNESACRDFSEEAIPERDPAYRLPDCSDGEALTVESVSAEMRVELACRLLELGMSRARAAVLANL